MPSRFCRQHRKPHWLGPLPSDFPCLARRQRLLKTVYSRDYCTFALDMAQLVTTPRMNMEEFPGKRQRIDERKRRRPNEILYEYTFLGHRYRVFQGIGDVRPILFNPRDFLSFNEFKKYVESVISARDYHLTRVDFAFYLSKHFFSVEFVLNFVWMKGYGLAVSKPYKNLQFQRLNGSRYQKFYIGKGGTQRLKVYDCDAHNVDKMRPLEKMVHNSINFEIQARTPRLKQLGFAKLEDLNNISFKQVMGCLEFFEPTATAFRNTSFEPLIDVWKEKGLQATLRASNKYLNKKGYDKIIGLFSPLRAGNKLLKDVMIAQAEKDHNNWLAGKVRHRYPGSIPIAYEMKPLFGKDFLKTAPTP